MKTEYRSRDLRRLPGITYDTLRTWAGRRNKKELKDSELKTEKKKGRAKRQPVLLSPINPQDGTTHEWIYDSNAVERIWWIRMLQMLGYKNEQIEKIFSVPNQDTDKEIWKTLDEKINDLSWRIQHLETARKFAEKIRSSKHLPNFPHKEDVDDIEVYLEVLPVNPKTASSGYESGSRELMKAFGMDKDAIIAKNSTPEKVSQRDSIYCLVNQLRKNHVPAGAQPVLELISIYYQVCSETTEFDLNVLHGIGTILAKHEKESYRLDKAYGNGFSVYFAEAVFIYCFVQSLPLNEEE